MELKTDCEVIAHRGLHHRNGVIENSRQAVVDAFASDVDGIEVDLQLLGDGTIVLFHDPTLKQDQYHPLGSLTYSQFKDLLDFEPLSVKELLALDWKGKRVILECKPHRNHLSFVRRLLKTLPDQTPSANLTLSSYDWDILLALDYRSAHNLAPVVTSFSGRTARFLDTSEWFEWHLDVNLASSSKTEALTDNHDVVFWTVNDRSSWENLERLSIKGIMTDNSDAF